MDQLHRIAWIDRLTGERGHGDWLRGRIEDAQYLADAMNEEYPDLVHRVQSAWGEGSRLTPASGRVPA